jgi:TatA/E family protein of Tat protein translocase
MPLGLHLPDLLVLIILLIFGSKKLPETGEAIGKSIISFKKY